LVVDYLGLADQLKKALITYTESGGQGNPTYDTAQAIAVMLEKHGIACDMMHGFNWDKWTTGKPAERLALMPAGQEHILEQEDGKKRWVQVVTELSRAFALCAASDEATEIRDDVSFFQALQVALNLGMDRRFVLETPLMWLDNAATWRLAESMGGAPLVAALLEHTHSCYLGDRQHRHAWGYGCGTCPACDLRAKGWAAYAAVETP
jgi:hypothetical protein